MAETIVNCRVDLGCAIWVLSIRPIGRDSSPDRAGAMRCTRSIWVEHRCRWNREQKCKALPPPTLRVWKDVVLSGGPRLLPA